jgi:pyrimidine deaminase RibD-like protein
LDAMLRACEQAARCTPSETAYSVGALLVDGSGAVLATGYSRELPGNTHAEECALIKVGCLAATGEAGPSPNAARGCAMFTTMEPCSLRLSGKTPCADLLRAAGVARVVVAVFEPPTFVAACSGVQQLRDAGVRVDVVDDAECRRLALAPNAHLAGR